MCAPSGMRVATDCGQLALALPPPPPRELDIAAVRRTWERRLEAEGMPAELRPIPARLLQSGPTGVPRTAEGRKAAKAGADRGTREAFDEAAREHLWSHRWPSRLHRRIWEAYVVEGLSTHKIARKLGCAVGTVSNVMRANRALIGWL